MVNPNPISKQRILIVEDDAIIARFIQLKLEELGYEICGKARSGKEAIDIARNEHPDLIMMDVMLDGELDGIETVEVLMQYMDVPVVYLTASSDDQTIRRLMKTEPHGFLIKPFDDKILESALHIAVYRHKARKELSETKEMLRTTLESIDDMVFSLDENGVITHNHSGTRNIPAFTRFAALQGKTIQDAFPGEVAERIVQSIEMLHMQKNSQSLEFSLVEDDHVYWYNCRFTLRRGRAGTMEGVTMVVSDVTRNKQIYQELALSREKLSEAFSIAGLGSCDFFFREQKHVCNDLFFDIIGIADPTQKNTYNYDKLTERVHPHDRNRFKITLQQALDAHRNDFSLDFRVMDDQNQIKYIHALSRIKYDVHGEPERMIMTFQDVSWQKANESLRHDVEMAMKTAGMKQKFFAKLSHEIRNPVSGITGLLHLLEATQISPEQAELIESLKSSSESLLELVNDVLDFSKIESGMMSVRTHEFKLPELFTKLRSFYRAKAREKTIELLLQVDSRIPERIASDEHKILRVLSNLVSNALKFTQEGSVEVRVGLAEQTDSKLLLKFEVCDTGSGISPHDQKKLFKEFSQLENGVNSQYKGSGLGLSICKELVELLGGEIGVESQIGQGSNFWFHIPVIAVVHSSTVRNEELQSAAMQKDLDLSVLLAEDIAVNRKVIQLMLEQMGCKVTLAVNGKEALEKFTETTVNAFDIFGKVHYDIILLDQVMPIMDGVTALKNMKKLPAVCPPVIVLTADESFAHDQKYAREGFDDVLIKPVKPHQLYNMLRKWKESRIDKGNQAKLKVDTLKDIELKPVANDATLEMIVRNANGDRASVENLFQSFFEDIDRIYKQTLGAIEVNDYNALGLIILSIKGLSGNMGASRLHAVARLMDRYLRNEEYSKAVDLIALLADKYSEFRTYIETEFIHQSVSNPS